ncbi:hypothetical protein UFOVP138_54 [uncultured Caudovirales phage]|uniref:Dit-like phage tail protein N-terminal domain-containing protein n=1 Tax=uncultured Caudovirales phage TaxID=2100421 RepID=A0A6J5LD14_9CAUD|nr:hypothetical protein UFOVP138_54 [uncultured Caudovirales phage]
MTFPVQQQSTASLNSTPPVLKSADLIAIFDASFNQAFTMARPLKVNVNVQSKLCDHPIETGATMSDFRIALPTEIELSLVCTGADYKGVYQSIRDAYNNGQSFILVTKADTYYNLMIQAMPHEETPDMFDVIAIALKLREILIVDTLYQPFTAKKVAKKTDVSTVKTGETIPAPTASYAAQAMNFFAH